MKQAIFIPYLCQFCFPVPFLFLNKNHATLSIQSVTNLVSNSVMFSHFILSEYTTSYIDSQAVKSNFQSIANI